MATIRTIFAAIAIIVVILIGGAVGLFFLLSKTTTTTTPTTSITSSTKTTSTTNTSPICTTNCALQLVQAGGGPVLNSTLTTPMAQTLFPGDGPCCSSPPAFQDEINYTDNGNLWVLQGDMEPMGGAWAIANSSGLTLEYQACPTTGNLTLCGPWHENWQDGEGSMDSSIYADLGGIPVLPPGVADAPSFGSNEHLDDPALTTVPSAEVFSIDVNIPYHSYYQSCTYNDVSVPAGAGCTYEYVPGTTPATFPTPYDSATFGFDVSGDYDIVSVAEVCNPSNNCATNELELSAYTSNGGSSINLPALNTTYIPFTANNNITIATNRENFIEFYADNILLYSSSKLPIAQNPSYGSGVLEFATRTSINNETDIVTFSNVTVYAASEIYVSGLSSGMTLNVKSTSGFSAVGTANSSGIATVNVADHPSGLTVSVVLNGRTIATYSTPVDAGSKFELTN